MSNLAPVAVPWLLLGTCTFATVGRALRERARRELPPPRSLREWWDRLE